MNRLLGWSVGLPLGLLVAVFAISNRTAVHLELWPLPIDPIALPAFLVVLLPLAIGLIGGVTLAWIAATPDRRQSRDKSRRIESLERQLGAIRGRPDGG
ncbi:ABC transporter permease family protein [Magnetospirillum molischianum]|uniref:Lipopolysaccharide assembly protein A domain-containing protein n=1 Tax=Magnetospirillum molischianum DSM 120 TaxID=1150626 RepID=H8FW44_MAGML|nr:LapA family protein [Magnetospirillum molischianum]CCG42582.1 conserved exported hypothetical protein [Magnetospirillum molischianum DSM 120]